MKQIGELFGKPVFTGRDVQRTFKKEDYIYLPSDKIEEIKKAGVIGGDSTPVIDEDDLTKGEYIDLGLPSGTLWCSHNLGAEQPCYYGDFYAWGETTPKRYYSWSTYKHGSNNKALTKYNYDSSKGRVDNKTVLESEDDAVYVATNGVAHMPTVAQIDELLNETISRWRKCTVLGDDHTTHDVFGRLFTSKTNGNCIFIPASGFQDGSTLTSTSYFSVWSNSLSEDTANSAYELDSDSTNIRRANCLRYYGLSVRGVKD